MERAERQWSTLFKSSLERRLSRDLFAKFVKQLGGKSPVPGSKLAVIFFKRISRTTHYNDPRLPLYIDCLLDESLLDSADVLFALLLHSAIRPPQVNNEGQDDDSQDDNLRYAPQLECNVLLQLTRKFVGGARPKTQTEARLTFRALHEWTSTVVAYATNETMMQAMGAEVQQLDQYNFALIRDAVGQLLIAALENPKMGGILDVALGKAARKALSQSVSAFIPLWTQILPQFAARLENAQRTRGLVDEKRDSALHGSGLDIAIVQVESVLDLPLMRTRAHLFVLISAMSVGLPLTDETVILSYLNFIYKGDTPSLVVELITASFDALSGAQGRHESQYVMFMLRSFLINKVPTIFSVILGSTFQSLNMEFYITEALTHIDPTAFPSFSDSFLNATSPLSDVRQDFVFSCTRHGLLPPTSVERLLGEAPMTSAPTPAERYVKENLVAQCTSNPDKVENLMEELEKIDGNAGAIAHAVTEMLRTYCTTKETLSLKNLCNALSQKPLSMGVMLQFTSPRSILQPLCDLLDSWRYEEDQGEYQPVYDEFAAILLLVLAYIYRFALDVHDVGISSSSFVAQLLVRGHVSRSLDELSTEEQKFLDGWILGLFNPEGEGISDEVMSGCRPQDFYLLVPTIVSQAVSACTADVIDIKTLKSGFEYLSLPFLFPSIVGTINWLCDHIWEQNHNDSNVATQLLQKLTKPMSSSSSSSGDATQAMHATIMQIIHPKLDAHLKLLDRREPTLHGVIDHLQQSIKPYAGFHVGSICANDQGLPDNILSASGNLRNTIKAAVQSLTIWSANASIAVSGISIVQSPPPIYSPRVLQLAIKLLEPSTVLQAMIEEVKAQTDAGNGTIAIDVATALVCAPTPVDSPISVSWSASPVPVPSSSRTGLNLRDALTLAFEDAPAQIKRDESTTQAVIRLHRRVEALCLGLSIAGEGGLSAAAVAAAAAVGADVNVDGLAIDTSAASQMQLDEAMGLEVSSSVHPMAGLLGDDILQQQTGVYDTTAGIGAVGLDLTAADLTSTAGDGTTGDIAMDLMQDGEDDMFAGLDLGADLNFD